jgi:hypothetical protein
MMVLRAIGVEGLAKIVMTNLSIGPAAVGLLPQPASRRGACFARLNHHELCEEAGRPPTGWPASNKELLGDRAGTNVRL